MGETLTLDSNVILEYWKDQDRKAIVEELLALARAREVSLMVTARIREDIPRDPLSAEIDRLPELGVHEGPSITRLGYWVLGRDMLASDEFVAAQTQIDADLERRGHAPPDWRDWDHLHAHLLQRRNMYLTWDRRILEVSPILRERFGIQIKRPEAYLEERNGPRQRRPNQSGGSETGG